MINTLYLIRVKRMDNKLLAYPWEVGVWVGERTAYYGPASFNPTAIGEATIYSDIETAQAAIDARAKGFKDVEFEIVLFAEMPKEG